MFWLCLSSLIGGAILGVALCCLLLHRSHENFRKMCSTSPKGK